MMSERFTEVYPNIIESNYHFKDNGKGITHKEVVELLNSQNEMIEIFREFLELNDFDADEIIRQGKELEL